MSKRHNGLCILCGLLAFAVSSFGQQPNFNVKTGLWESTITTHMSGIPQLPEDKLAQLSPEQRARVEAAMQGMAANGGQPHTSKSCLTKEKLAKGFDPANQEETRCKRTIVTNSAKVIDMKENCSTENGTMSGTFHIEANGTEATTGSMHMVITQGGKTMTTDGTFQGKWLSADCGGVN